PNSSCTYSTTHAAHNPHLHPFPTRRSSDLLEMAETAIADGITHVVATPHSSDSYRFDFATVRRLRDELQNRIGNRLKLATGCDFHLNPENLAALGKEPRQYCINQRDYLLVEFNEVSIPPAMDTTLHEVLLS